MLWAPSCILCRRTLYRVSVCDAPSSKGVLNMSYGLKVLLFAVFLLATSLPAAAAATTGRAKTMAVAARAIHYPKAGALKVTCRGKASYRCVATYRHHRRRVFYARWDYYGGGWIDAGPKLATAKLLRNGFALPGDPAGISELAARGFMANHYNSPQPYVAYLCKQTATWTWTCGYKLDNGTANISITLKKVKAGFVFTGSSTVS